MNYQEAIEYIHGTLKFGSKLGLERITGLLSLMGNPQSKLKFVHVTGTNGKGSTTSLISNILIDSGYRVGVFTSPYIQRFTERIKIGNSEIKPDELADIIAFVKTKIAQMLEMGLEHPTEFEIITATAFEYFYRCKCDIVVLEVGLGGRYDSTNVIDSPEVAVITTISLDHTDKLGETLEEIAYIKAGIIKENCSVVVYPQKKEIIQVFENECCIRKATIHKVDFESLKLIEFSLKGQLFDYKDYKNLTLRLLGEHQLFNAAVAINACEVLINKGYKIANTNIRNGILNTVWPGRLEIISTGPMVLIDGAHNFEGGQSLNAALEKYFSEWEKVFIVGFLGDKDYEHIVELLADKAKLIITVTPDNPRAIPSDELAKKLKKYTKNVIDGINLESGFKTALDNTGPNGMVCAFGSLYMIGRIRDILNKK